MYGAIVWFGCSAGETWASPKAWPNSWVATARMLQAPELTDGLPFAEDDVAEELEKV